MHGSSKQIKAAIVSMPWNSIQNPSIQISLLKSILNKNQIQAHACHFYLNLIRYISINDYSKLSKYRSGLLGEWLFNQELHNAHTSVHEINNYIGYLKNEGAIADLNDLELINNFRNYVVPRYLSDCENELISKNYDLIGFSCTFNQLVPSLALANRIKQKNNAVKIVFGGTNFDGKFSSEVMSAYPWIDAIFNGESDESFPNYVKSIFSGNDLSGIPGICFKNNGQINANEPTYHVNLDDIPIPDYTEFFNTKLQIEKKEGVIIPIESLPVETSRGCWWSEKHVCTFCSITEIRKKFRVKSPQRLLQELDTLYDSYAVEHYFATERINVPQIQSETNFLSLLKNKNYKLCINLKANIKRKDIEFISKASVYAAIVGVESLNTRLLKLVSKGVTAIENFNFLKWATHYNLKLNYFILYRIYGELADDYLDMEKKIALIYHFFPPTFFLEMSVYRHTKYFEERQNYPGLKVTKSKDWEYIFPADLLPNPGNNPLGYVSEFEGSQLMEKYHKKLDRKIFIWKEIHKKENCYMTFNTIGNELVISDNRKALTKERQYKFTDLAKSLYLVCDEPRSTKYLSEKFNPEHKSNLSTQINATLSNFVSNGLMYTENEQYLSLALPGRLN